MVNKKKGIPTTQTFDFVMSTKARVNVLIGGAGSGKSYSMAQALIAKFYHEQDIQIWVVRKTLPSLKLSILKLIKELLDEYRGESKYPTYHYNKTSLIFTYGQNQIRFLSIDDPAKIMSAEANIIFCEEACELDYKDYQMLKLRLRRKTTGNQFNQIFLASNPANIESCLKRKVIDLEEGVEVNHSTYKNNPYLDPEARAELESYIGGFRTVYTEGKWLLSQELVFTGWKIIPYIKFYDQIEEITFGSDWGWNHKATLLRAYHLKNGNVIWEEMLYKSGITQEEFAGLVKETIPIEETNKYLYVDSAEQGLIKSLSDKNLNVYNAKKNVMDGLSYCMQHLEGILPESKNLARELRAYSWKKNREGEILDEPLKFMDDLIDAGRYSTYSYSYNLGSSRVVGNFRTGEWYDD